VSETAVAAGPRRKTFTYRTTLEWVGGRAGVLESRDKLSFRVSSPPEFKGDPDVWTPEDLFVGAVNVCTMATFVAFAERGGLRLEAYTSEAEGTLEFVDGCYRVTRVTVRPRIVVLEAAAVEVAKQVLADAHEKCIISNSIRSTVVLEPTVEAGTSAAG
jgi:peroxiredoxin-like protein